MRILLGRLKTGLVFVVSAPAGTGKTTLVRMLCKQFPCVVESVSFTTRPPRRNEIPGIDYHFISTEEFERKIQEGDFLEYAKVFNDYYGTSKKFVEQKRREGKHVILVIDTQGALQLKEKYSATFIFLSPPSLEELGNRLRSRQTESEAKIAERLAWAEREIQLISSYDYHIVNEDLSIAYEILKSILIAEENKIR